MKFVISCAPSSEDLPRWLDLWSREGVKHVVRACEPTYPVEPLNNAGISLHVCSSCRFPSLSHLLLCLHTFCFSFCGGHQQLEYPDGTTPTDDIIDEWMEVVDRVFPRKGRADDSEGSAIAVHCMAGLGRAPLFVALAFVLRGMPKLKAIEFVRSKRRGAINAKQLEFLRNYKPRSHHECTIM